MELTHFSFNILALLAVASVASHAALSPELYWQTMLPNTPMPESVKALLTTEMLEEDSTSVNVGKGTGVNVNKGGTSVNFGKGGVNVHGGHTTVGVRKGTGVNVNTGKGKPGGTSVGVAKGGVNVHTGKGSERGGGTTVGVGKGGVNVNTGPKKKGTHVAVGGKPGYKSPFDYMYAAEQTQIHDDPNVALFFLEKDLRRGITMMLKFPKSVNTVGFLPRMVTDMIPFSSKKLPEILDHFALRPESEQAVEMKNTIEECEKQGIKGEDKYCATSLESMVDYTTSKLGRDLLAVSTEVKEPTETGQKYTIVKEVKRLKSDRIVACHKQKYPFAVFYCHESWSTKAFVVPLMGEDGSEVKAVAVCHMDTSAWNPKHLAFQLLKVQPGSVPICHFLPRDHIVWVPKQRAQA